MKAWGIDLGGTKIECAILDTANNMEVIVRQRIPTEANKGYDHILSQVKKLVNAVSKEVSEQPVQIGFATPGVLDPGIEVMKNCNTTCMNGKPMHKDLEEIVGVPVKIANDANCFALSEALMGAGKNYPHAQVVFGVIMGTGVGGGLVVHNKIIEGHHGIGGEWGHNILEENGNLCYCGKRGCVEQVISGPALQEYYLQQTNRTLDLKQILENHLNGRDEHATATIERLLEYYGKAISTLINVLDPRLNCYRWWSEADIKQTEKHFKEVIYQVLKDFAPFANGNWDAAAIKTVMSIGVFCNDKSIFERALKYYVNGHGNGRLTYYVINEEGQVQESGRDQGHTQLGIGMLAECSEIAWHQGLNLYGYADNRLLKGFEYVAKFNLGNEVPFN